MTAPTPLPDFHLVPIGGDGRPAGAGLILPPGIAEILEATRALYATTGFAPPWISYLAVSGGKVVGGGAFVGPPRDGAVEVAYFTLPDHQGKGFASRTAAGLIRIARQAAPSVALWAKTLPERNASTRVLERHGFRRDGTVSDHEIGTAWRWQLRPGEAKDAQ